MQARRNVQAAIRPFRHSHEHRIAYNNNRKKFYDHIYKICCVHKGTPRLTCDGEIMPDLQSAEFLSAEFASNFSSSNPCNNINLDNLSILNENCLHMFNCTEHLVIEALCQCSNTKNSPYGISFKLLKIISGRILQPLNIIYQHSLYEGIFPRA